jgi:hypothetical protein
MCSQVKSVVRSHLYPAALYQLFRSVDDTSPLRVGDGVIMHTDRQMQDYLLCLDCEDALNRGGETWMIPRLATMKKDFPLYEALLMGPATELDEGGAVYSAADNQHIDIQKVCHFAVGIFWKASVHSWKGDEQKPMIDLGICSDRIRRWLRAEVEFPKNVCLSVMLLKPDRALIAAMGPVEVVERVPRNFLLYVPGILFTLTIGDSLELDEQAACFLNGPGHPVLVDDGPTEMLWRRLGQQFQESRKTKNYLARKAKRSQVGSG